MNKYLIIGAIVLTAVSFGLGRYSNQILSKNEDSEVNIDKVIKRDKDVKIVKTETSTKQPDGTEVKKIVTETETKSVTVKDISSQSKTEVETKVEPQYNVNLMVGVSKDNFIVPIYGASASKKFIGPFSLGVWGLTNGTGGLSVGMSF